MTERLSDERLDHEIRGLLAWQAEDVVGAPSAAEVATRISDRAGTSTTGLRVAPQLAWVLLAGLLIITFLGALAAGAIKPPPTQHLAVTHPEQTATASSSPAANGPSPSPSGPVVVIPPGVTSSQTADEVGKKMLAAIAANETKLGRSLGPPLLLRIQLLRGGEYYWTNRLDGTNPHQAGMAPDGGPGWMVEAMGTFLGIDPNTGRIDAIGMHGFHRYDDAGGEGSAFYPCRIVGQAEGEDTEGTCFMLVPATPVP